MCKVMLLNDKVMQVRHNERRLNCMEKKRSIRTKPRAGVYRTDGQLAQLMRHCLPAHCRGPLCHTSCFYCKLSSQSIVEYF